MSQTQSNKEPEVKPGRYRHYKGGEYIVLGVATYDPDKGIGDPHGHPILAGDESEENPTTVSLSRRRDGALFYENMGREMYGDLVIYAPDYGDRIRLFRTVKEFTEKVLGDVPRFERIGD